MEAPPTLYISYLLYNNEKDRKFLRSVYGLKGTQKKKTHQNAFIHNSTFNLSNRKYVSSVKNDHFFSLIRNFFKVRYERVCSKKTEVTLNLLNEV